MEILKPNKAQKILYIMLFLPCLFLRKGMDNDIWFLLNSGRYVMENGFPRVEPFTIHQGMNFVMQQWLSAVTFWVAYRNFGQTALTVMVVLFFILFIIISFKLSMFISENNFYVSYSLCLLVNLLMIPFFVERPHIFLFIIILLEMFCLEKYIKFQNKIYLFPLLIFSILLINLEAALWPILFVIFIPYLFDSFKFKLMSIEGQGYEKKYLIITLLGMLAVGFINPYGSKAMTYLFNSYGAEELSVISEMGVPDINSVFGKLMFLTIFTVFVCIFAYKKKSYRLRYHLLAIGTAYMTFSALRSFCFFVIFAIIPLSYLLKDLKIKFEVKNDKKTLRIRKILILLIGAVVVFIVLYKNTHPGMEKQQDLIKCVEYLEKFDKNKVILYTGFNEGGFLEFKGFKTYIDPRAEVFFKSNNKKSDIMKEYIQLQSGEIYYKDVLKEYNFTHLLVEKNDIFYIYLDYDAEYQLIYSSSYYKIYEHKR
ncbi:MAG: hypothetical protein ACM3X7_13045 [Solirubrobacterales bacterium]